jgi:hypothetical protein
MAQADDDIPPLLNHWRQGDVALLPVELPYLDLDETGKPFISAIEADHGVVLLSQSCDVIRDVEDKPLVQVAALVEVSAEELERVRQGHAPGLVYVPSVSASSLVADLDSAVTVHKKAIATWPRVNGCTNDEEQRQFAAALARHRQRFAFPDKFNDLVKPLRRWFEDKVGKNSPAGRCADATREIRACVDDWEAPTRLSFLVLVEGELPAEAVQWQKELDALAERRQHDDYPPFEFRLASFDGISAAEYLASDRLDWDGLSDA